MNRGKRFFTSVSLAVLLLFGLTVPAHAITTLTSTPLFVGDRVSFVCAITNVSPATITVTFQIMNRFGVPLDTAPDIPVAPGAAVALGKPEPLDVPYCKFTGNFNRALVRAGAQIVETATATTISVVPAQTVGE